ncbi:MAG: hypothetical protein K1X51_17585 [Rhodospirillaceae bacterium]|nr:hypothetical protein [Rhodospirillaceae bacterium]
MRFIIDGAVKQTLKLTAADVQKLPSVTIDVSYEARGKIQKSQFTGALLLDVLNKAASSMAKARPGGSGGWSRSRVAMIM